VAILVDGCPDATEVADYLQSRGIEDIDLLVATHPHADHIGGLAEVLHRFDVREIWVNGDTADSQTYTDFAAAVASERAAGASYRQISCWDSAQMGGLDILVLHPPYDLTGDLNEDSVVTKVTCGTVDVLLTGDATSDSEASMISDALTQLDSEVLKVGHHGSTTSTSHAFLDAIAPHDAVISVGAGNTYGHPSQQTLDRLAAAGATVYRTDQDGTGVLTSDCNTYFITTSGPLGPTATPAPTATPTPAPSACGPCAATDCNSADSARRQRPRPASRPYPEIRSTSTGITTASPASRCARNRKLSTRQPSSKHGDVLVAQGGNQLEDDSARLAGIQVGVGLAERVCLEHLEAHGFGLLQLGLEIPNKEAQVVKTFPVLTQELEVEAVAFEDLDQFELDRADSGKAQPRPDLLLLAAVPDIGRSHLPHVERAQPEGALVEGDGAVEVLHHHSDLAHAGQLELLSYIVC